MYSEEFMNYLIRYQNDELKPQEKKEESVKSIPLKGIRADKYITIPVKHEVI